MPTVEVVVEWAGVEFPFLRLTGQIEQTAVVAVLAKVLRWLVLQPPLVGELTPQVAVVVHLVVLTILSQVLLVAVVVDTSPQEVMALQVQAELVQEPLELAGK
jgi:hypothetical protein